MKYLNDLGFKNIEQVLWLDLESATIEENLSEQSAYWNAWEQKVRWDEKIVTVEDIKQRYKERAPIYKEFAKVISVSYGRVVEGILKVKKVTGDEKNTIKEVFKDIETFSSNGIKFLGVFSGKQFDIPFLSYRAIVNDIPLINSFDIGGIPVWNIKHLIDVQDILRSTSSTTLSLEGVCASFNMPSPKQGEVIAKNVNEMFWNGEIAKIAEYNTMDVLATCNVFCKYLGIPQVEMVIVGEDKVEELPLLQRLNVNKSVYTAELLEIKKLLKKPKVTQKDKDIVFEFIKASLSVIDPNFGRIVNDQEVNKIINQLKKELENN